MLTIIMTFGYAAPANAGFFDFVGSFFESASAEEKEPVLEVNSQMASLLAPSIEASITSQESVIVDDSALITGSGPLGTIADVEYFSPQSTKIETYIVRKGDSLSKIAKMYGVSVNTLIWANNLNSQGIIKEGQTLVILPISGVRHIVVAGDTLKSIAKKYGGDVQDITRFNNLSETSKLAIGDEVIIPDGELKTAPRSVASSPAKSRYPVYSGYYIRPISSGRKTQGLHGQNGVDLAPACHCEGAESIFAAADGVVLISRNTGWNGGYGRYIVIAHPNGTQTLYGHAFATFVSEGDSVRQGQVIGTVGNSGKSTGPHLHFEIRGAYNPF